MTWDTGALIVGVVTIAAFAVAFHLSGLVMRVRATVAAANRAIAVIRDNNLNDREKERLVQRAALHLLSQFVLITMTAVVVLTVPGIVMLVGDLAGVASFASVYYILWRWEIIMGASVLTLITVWVVRRR